MGKRRHAEQKSAWMEDKHEIYLDQEKTFFFLKDKKLK